MRAAIYARFSSDLQDLRSIADQVDLARRYAEGRGLHVVDVYDDAAISGASTLNRPGLLRLIANAQARKFEVIIPESLDQLSRARPISRHSTKSFTSSAFASRPWPMVPYLRSTSVSRAPCRPCF